MSSWNHEPPYYAVMFSSRLRDGEDDQYQAMAARMVALAERQPGYLGLESVRDADGRGITISYWTDEAAIRAWREQVEHREARRLGREKWYRWFSLRVARVERQQFGESDDRPVS